MDGQWPQGPFYQPEADKWPDLEIRAADGRFHIVPYKEFISGQAEPFVSRACRIATLSRPASRSCRLVKPRRGASLALASVILALGAGPLLLETGKSGFPKQFSGRRPKLLRQPPSCSLPSFWRWGVAGRASRNKFPSDESGGILERQWPRWPFYQPEADKWPDLQIRAADGRFHIVPYKEFISGQAEPFYQGLAEWQLYQGRLAAVAVYQSRLQAGQPMAVLSRIAVFSRLRRRPVAAMAVLSMRSVQMARSVDLGCGWSISYCPAQAVYQRPGRAFLERAG